MRLRRARPDEQARVLAVLEGCSMYTTSVTLEGGRYWLAEDEDTPDPLGCIGLESGAGCSLIRSAAVLPPARGRGLGRRLAGAALDCARERGDRAVYLFSDGAGAFWSRLGFEAVDTAEIAQALPNTPQVRHGLAHGWIHEEQGWRLALA